MITDMEPTNMAEEDEEVLKDVQEEEETTARSGRVISRPARASKTY